MKNKYYANLHTKATTEILSINIGSYYELPEYKSTQYLQGVFNYEDLPDIWISRVVEGEPYLIMLKQ